MVVGESGDDPGAELVRLGMGQFESRDLLEMVVQQPGVIDQGLQDQGLAAGNRAALAAHGWAHGELRTGRLGGAAAQRRRASYPLPFAATRPEPAATARPARGKTAG